MTCQDIRWKPLKPNVSAKICTILWLVTPPYSVILHNAFKTECVATHKRLLIHGQALLLDSYVVKKFLRSVQHEAGGTWEPNYNPGLDFL